MSELERILSETKITKPIAGDIDYEKRIRDMNRVIDSINSTIESITKMIQVMESDILRLENIRNDIEVYLEAM